jgi:SAM-dependent methyltransferase
MMVNAASRWSPAEYARHGAFVPALGAAALTLLDPQPDELILDIGCGDGTLTKQIGLAGARAIGLDASPEMVEAARAKGVDAFVADAQAFDLKTQVARFGRFDAAFSNAALHWMLDPASVAAGVFALLRPGGRFAGEMGGEGNLEILRGGLRDELVARGYDVPVVDPQWYASPEEFAGIYQAAGFGPIEAWLIDRPTPLPTGIAGWVKTFRSGWLDVCGVPVVERDDLAQAVEARLEDRLRDADGNWHADYIRLRFRMNKPS